MNWGNWLFTCKKMKIDAHKNQLKIDLRLNVRPEAIKILRKQKKNTKEMLQDNRMARIFWIRKI
jgi:hypothetical protein